jgi:hypothetical protein
LISPFDQNISLMFFENGTGMLLVK